MITLKAFAKETHKNYSGGRIDRIVAPSEDEIILNLRARGVNSALTISCRAGMPRIHLSAEKARGGQIPTPFCMVLRKYLSGSRIDGIRILNEDRIVEINVTSRNELNDELKLKLITEIMGGSSNVILTDENYTVIDAMKRVVGEKTRTVLPRHRYELPQRGKTILSESAKVSEIIGNAAPEEAVKTLCREINGLSKESAAELYALSAVSGAERAAARMDDLYSYEGYSPCVILTPDGTPKGFYAYPYATASKGNNTVRYPTLSEAMEAYYSAGVAAARKADDTRKLNKKLKALKAKAKRHSEEADAVLASSGEKERYRELAEILQCNVYRVERGASIIICDDFYNTRSVEIALDPTISPQKNVERYFRKYAKAKGAESYARAEKERSRELLDYLMTIETAISNCSSDAEYAEIEAELDALAGKRKSTSARGGKTPKKTPPLRLDIEGFTAYVGKNNSQNEEVTFSIASGKDLWLHVKNYHGAHGVILQPDRAAPLGVIRKVAEAVAYYSEARAAASVEVDYTLRKFVKKLGKPGLVRYTDNKTVVVKPVDPERD